MLNIAPPEKVDDAFVAWLVQRGRMHRHLDIADGARQIAARQVLADRRAAEREGFSKVGLAEYIDLLAAIHELTQDSPAAARGAEQIDWLRRLGVYALVKNAGQPQDRPPVEPAAPPAPEDDREER